MELLAVVLAGGTSSRMGTDKAALSLDGVPLVQRVVTACLAAGCSRVVVVAPDERATRTLAPDRRVAVTLEDPPLGGPSAGIAAGLARLSPAPDDQVLLLACDLPQADRLVPELATVDGQDRAVVPVDDQGWPQYLAARYPGQVLEDAVVAQHDVRDLSVRRLMRGVEFHPLALPAALLLDVDSPEQARAAGLEVGPA